MDKRLSNPPIISVLTGKPITGNAVVAAITPPRCAALPAAQIITSVPFFWAFTENSWASSGVRCAEITLTSTVTPKLFNTTTAGLTTPKSDLLPINIATLGILSLRIVYLYIFSHTFNMVLLYVIFSVYILAVNFYAVMLIKSQRDESGASDKPAGDGKIILTAILGGAIALYVSMFVMRYRLKNLLLMILLPVIAVLNVWFFYLAFRSGFTFFVVR